MASITSPAGNCVTAGKYPRDVRLLGLGIGADKTRVVRFETHTVAAINNVGFPAHGKNDLVRIHHEMGAVCRLGCSASAQVECTEFHIDAFDLGNMAVFRGERQRGNQRVNAYAFAFCIIYVLFVSAHFPPGPPVENGNLLGALSFGGTRRVNGGIVPSNDDDPLPVVAEPAL